MDWKALARKVATHAPLLASLLPGPAGPIVGAIVANAFDVPNTPDAVSLALTANPDAAARLREIEAAHAERLRQLQNEQLKLEADDRHSARRAAIDGGYAWGVFGFAVLIFLSVATCEAMLLLGFGDALSQGVSPEMLGRILGTLDAAMMLSLAYVFGGSADVFRARRATAARE